MKRTIISCLLFALTAIAPSAQAGTKEELLRLQNDVLALQNQLRLVEKTFNEKTDGLRSLVVQLNDQIGKSNQILGKISATLETQSMGEKSESQALLQEIRNVSAKVDDFSDLKVQAKPITQRTYQSPGGDSGNPSLSADAIYTEAFNDLVQGNLDLAIEGFSAFIKNYPSHERADDAQYNIGEAYYNSGKYPQAISAFTRVLNDYPSADKVPSAYFKRAKAELVINERDNAIEDLKIVVQKYSSSAEAGLAKNELSTLGVQLNKPVRSGSTRRKP
jgi:tol-pal system protein YbgF